jgi:hypothetical protein
VGGLSPWPGGASYRRRTAKQRDELASLHRCNHSITPSASAASAALVWVVTPRTMLPPALFKPDNFQAALAVFSSTFSTMTAVS